MKVKIVTPQGILLDTEAVVSITLPTEDGIITILEDHIPIISVLAAGELLVRLEKGEENFVVSGGVIEVMPGNIINIMADTAERAADINLEEAEAAYKRAQEYMEQKISEQNVDFVALQGMIEKELARVTVAKKYRNVR